MHGLIQCEWIILFRKNGDSSDVGSSVKILENVTNCLVLFYRVKGRKNEEWCYLKRECEVMLSSSGMMIGEEKEEWHQYFSDFWYI